MQQFQNPESDIQNLKSISEVCSSHKAPMGVPSHMGYKLADGVQVREEKFGLLFYNYRGPRLYFLPTKDLIASDFFNGHKIGRLFNNAYQAGITTRITADVTGICL